jgi:hypothetical protein
MKKKPCEHYKSQNNQDNLHLQQQQQQQQQLFFSSLVKMLRDTRLKSGKMFQELVAMCTPCS